MKKQHRTAYAMEQVSQDIIDERAERLGEIAESSTLHS